MWFLPNCFLLLLSLAMLGAAIDSNGMDRGDGIYIHDDSGQIVDYMPLDKLNAREPQVNATELDSSPLEARLTFDVKCFGAKFDKNDLKTGLSYLGDEISAKVYLYGSIAARTYLSVKYNSVLTYVCNYSKGKLVPSSAMSGTVNANLDTRCGDNMAARGDDKSGISYGRTAKGKPFCN
ncbi:hypothetical protein F5Y05DRAFT_413234 [Hypoxylon sp. FL0543]|nr:hypothetical protein F5Y05DRAFT_413234 [Hypoxylon sp. FL0543]